MKKVAIFARSGLLFNKILPKNQTISKLMGNNTGNLLFWNSISPLIQDESINIMDQDKFPSMKSLNSTFDLLILPLANHLSLQILKPQFVDLLKKVQIPMLILGIGGQISLQENLQDYTEELKSHSHYQEFISILNDKCVAIATRGLSSTKILEESGFEGTIYTTGCPSQTISSNPQLGEEIKNHLTLLKQKQVPLKVIHNLASFYKKNLSAIDKHISKITENILSIRIQQSGSNLVFERFGGSIFDEFDFCSHQNSQELKQEVDYLFTNCEAWAAVVSRYTFSIGTRLHGNQMPLQLGIPTLTIAHDLRVVETCEQMGVPYCKEDRFFSFKDIWDAVERIDSTFDPKKFDQIRIKNCQNLRLAILKVGLNPSEKLNTLSKSKC